MSKILYKYETFVHFDEADPGGVLFFGKFFGLAHRCLESFMSDSKLGWKSWFGGEKTLVPLRHCSADFIRPVFPGKNYSVEMSAANLGESSVTFAFQVKDGQHVCAELKTVHVFISVKDRQKVAIPEEIRQILSAGSAM